MDKVPWRLKNPEKWLAAKRKWQENNPGRQREYDFKRKFGITVQQYDAFLAMQNHECAICHTAQCLTGRRLAVDHCHTSKVVRGLLCANCNLLVGQAKDNPEVLRAAANYLDKPSEES